MTDNNEKEIRENPADINTENTAGSVLNGSESVQENTVNTEAPEYHPAETPVSAPQAGQYYYPPENKKRKKESRPAKLSAVIAVCIAAVLLCACAGFFGAKLAGKMNRNDAAPVRDSETPLVIYKAPEKESSKGSADGGNMTYADVAAAVKDSVVEINTEYVSRSSWFQYLNGGAGSGVILTEDGTIITNAHVVMKQDASGVADSITVRLSNSEEYKAECKGYDTEADIAILKIEAEGLTPVKCGNSDNLIVGEEVLVVGNPLGSLGGSVTNGIISATERKIEVNGTKMTLIQTNAAVNPGNSGGGMFNMNGELIGIVNAKSYGTEIEGLGFAIPVNDTLKVTEQLLEFGYVRGKVKLGVTFRTISSNTFYYYYNITPGIYVESLEEGLNDKELQVGDRIIAVEGNEVKSLDDIKSVIQSKSVGDVVKFQLYRDGKLIEANVTLYEQVPTENDKDSDVQFDETQQNDPSDYWFSDGGIEDFFSEFFR